MAPFLTWSRWIGTTWRRYERASHEPLPTGRWPAGLDRLLVAGQKRPFVHALNCTLRRDFVQWPWQELLDIIGNCRRCVRAFMMARCRRCSRAVPCVKYWSAGMTVINRQDSLQQQPIDYKIRLSTWQLYDRSENLVVRFFPNSVGSPFVAISADPHTLHTAPPLSITRSTCAIKIDQNGFALAEFDKRAAGVLKFDGVGFAARQCDPDADLLLTSG